MPLKNKFNPNIAIHPGETLKETLDYLEMSQVDLAERTGLTTKTINEIVKGKNPITQDTAMKLSSVFGMSSAFWNNLERNYQETLSRIKVEEKIEKELDFFKKFSCYNELAKYGYIKKTRDIKEKVINLHHFFGVSSLGLVPKVQAVAFRTTKNKEVFKESLAAWLRCGELEAQNIEVKKFDKEKLINSIKKLRVLTKERPNIFQEKLIEICSSFGVAVVFIPYFKNTYVKGATRWLTPDKAIIQLSLMGGFSDIFWFTFFHELAHLLKHGKKDEFIEFKDGNNTTEEEKEADEFACNALIPKKEFNDFFSRKPITATVIKKFAEKMDLPPGIVAGRLGHECKGNAWKKLSFLRTRLKFEEPN